MAQVGIDLGTTNSVIATMEDRRVEVILNRENKNTTPSVVFFNSSDLDQALVGESALNSINSAPDRASRFIKREMGKDFKFRVDDKSYSPEEISAAILKKLARDAESEFFGGDKVTHAVITVPAHFGPQERAATKRAAELAGLQVLSIVAEPIAAAIDFAETHGANLADQTLLVYDFGGGTFDVTVMRIESRDGAKNFRILGKKGAIELGGADIDERLTKYASQDFAAANEGKDPMQSTESYGRLMRACQLAKETVSVMEDENAPYSIACTHDGLAHNVSITRKQFEELIEPLVNRTIDMSSELVQELFSDSANPWENINMILLAGGSTKMKIIWERLRGLSGMEPRTNRGVDLNVGRGAAYLAFSPDAWTYDTDEGAGENPALPGLKGAAAEHGPRSGKIAMPRDLVNFSVGIEVVDPINQRDIYQRLICVGSEVGSPVKNTFGLWENGQTGVDIKIYRERDEKPTVETEKELHDVELLGNVQISGLPATTRRGEPVEVEIEVSPDGLIVGECMHVPSGIRAIIKVELEPRKAFEDERE